MPVDHPIHDFDRIKERFWRFTHDSGYLACEQMHFRADGSVGGYQHDNERYWRIENSVLCLLNSAGVVTVRFDDAQIRSGRLFLQGRHIPNPDIGLCLEELENRRLTFSETRTALTSQIEKFGWSIGDHTYGLPQFIEPGSSNLVIGKYCSIAGDVRIAFGDHRTDIFTTYPFRALQKYWWHVPLDVPDHVTKGDVVIGHDVWIGFGVFIGSGVTVGSGAVLGAKSVIVRDVPPYAIVVGNPGRIARYRFDPETISELLRLSWWDLADDAVDRLLPLLMSNDTPALLAALRLANPHVPPPASAPADQPAPRPIPPPVPPPVPPPPSPLAKAVRLLGFKHRP